MKFNPTVDITDLKQEVFVTMRLCESICANYGVEIFISYIDGMHDKFAISTKNMNTAMWHICKDIEQFLGTDYIVEDKFTDVKNNSQILIRIER